MSTPNFILDLCTRAHATAVSKGWWPTFSISDAIPKCIANIHGEVSEAWEAYRKGDSIYLIYMVGDKPEGFVIELADIVIRIADLCKAFDLDLDGAIQMKMEYNTTRSYRHGGKVA